MGRLVRVKKLYLVATRSTHAAAQRVPACDSNLLPLPQPHSHIGGVPLPEGLRYYRDYISDDIKARLKAAGFGAIKAESHLMTRVWAAQKAG